MLLPHYGIDQEVIKVPIMIEKALQQLRSRGYIIHTNCRFEEYKKRTFKDYIIAITSKDYKTINENYKNLLQGYKDYWELITIANSESILLCTNNAVRKEIQLIFSGNIIESDKNTTPWNYQFQYYLSSMFERSGLEVELEEPDFTFSFKGKKYSVAAKRLNGRGSIERNIRAAESQIKNTDQYGFIALSLDKIYKDMDTVETFNHADTSVRAATELIRVIIREYLNHRHFNDRSNQVLGIIAHIGFPFLLKSDKPLFELGYTAYTMFLPLGEPDSSEWNEVMEINNALQNFNIKTI
ncbi:hypothetical protein B9G55_19440 [Saccharibacillus sp. O16]|nr:hypothetical protein B9G55_19440 [Saccharibacillus sp. O16]